MVKRIASALLLATALLLGATAAASAASAGDPGMTHNKTQDMTHN